ncbi:hypothetical protein ABF226_002332 [Flavobacterium psychrophilum]
MTFKYQRIEHNLLLELLEDIEFANSLAYMIEYKNHTNLNITPHEYSIELSNDDIAISIILYVGFENREYENLKKHKIFYVVTLCDVIPEMIEFKDLNVKFIDKLALMNTIIAKSENSFAKKLNSLKNLKT